jgi:hypothetical protein
LRQIRFRIGDSGSGIQDQGFRDSGISDSGSAIRDEGF